MLQNRRTSGIEHQNNGIATALAALCLFPSFTEAQANEASQQSSAAPVASTVQDAAAAILTRVATQLGEAQVLVSNSVEKVDSDHKLYIGAYPIKTSRKEIEFGSDVVKNARLAAEIVADGGTVWAAPVKEAQKPRLQDLSRPRALLDSKGLVSLFAVRNDPIQRLARLKGADCSTIANNRSNPMLIGEICRGVALLLPIGKDYNHTRPDDGEPCRWSIQGGTIGSDVLNRRDNTNPFELRLEDGTHVSFQALSGEVADQHRHFRWNGFTHQESSWRDAAVAPQIWFAVGESKLCDVDGLAALDRAQRIIEQEYRAAIAKCVEHAGSWLARHAESESINESLLTLQISRTLSDGGDIGTSIQNVDQLQKFLAVQAHGLTEDTVPYFRAYLAKRCCNAKTEAEHQRFAKYSIDFERELAEQQSEIQQAKAEHRYVPPFGGAEYPWHKFSFSLPFVETTIGILEGELLGQGAKSMKLSDR